MNKLLLSTLLVFTKLPIISMHNHNTEQKNHSNIVHHNNSASSLKKFKKKFNYVWNRLFYQTMQVLFLDLNKQINNSCTKKNIASFAASNNSLLNTRNHLEEIFAKKLKHAETNILSLDKQNIKKLASTLAHEMYNSHDGWTNYLITQAQLELNESYFKFFHAPCCCVYYIKSLVPNCFYNRSMYE